MIEFKRYGKTVRISNENWKGLRERFNLNYARRYKNTYVIRVACPLCEIFKRYAFQACVSRNGRVCSFKQFSTGHIGCMAFFQKLFRNGPPFDGSWKNKISWQAEKDKQVRIQLNRIQKLMDEIEKEQD